MVNSRNKSAVFEIAPKPGEIKTIAKPVAERFEKSEDKTAILDLLKNTFPAMKKL